MVLIGQVDNYTVAAAQLIGQGLLAISLARLEYSIEKRRAFVFSSQCMAHCVCFPVDLRVLRLVCPRPRDLAALAHGDASVSLLSNGLLFIQESLPFVVAERVRGLDFYLLLTSHHGRLSGLLLPAPVVLFWL